LRSGSFVGWSRSFTHLLHHAPEILHLHLEHLVLRHRHDVHESCNGRDHEAVGRARGRRTGRQGGPEPSQDVPEALARLDLGCLLLRRNRLLRGILRLLWGILRLRGIRCLCGRILRGVLLLLWGRWYGLGRILGRRRS